MQQVEPSQTLPLRPVRTAETMSRGSGSGQDHTRGSPPRGETIRPWTAGITADQPTCHRCTWVPRGKRWALKFVNRSCWKHRRYA